jgi:dipeptidyl aminopeptidase/acylaminoacyl peptidase
MLNIGGILVVLTTIKSQRCNLSGTITALACTSLVSFLFFSTILATPPRVSTNYTSDYRIIGNSQVTMTIKARKFTPEVMLSAPRRSAGLPNDNQILYTESTYSFAEHKKSSEVRLYSRKSSESILVTEKAAEPVWLGNQVLLLVSGDDGATDVVIGDPSDFLKTSYVAGTIDGSASSPRIQKLGHGEYIIAFAAKAAKDGSLYNPKKAPKKHSTGRIYDSNYVRHWDTYVTAERNSIWYANLTKGASESSSKYRLGKINNALKGTGLESPVPPFGGLDCFDISKYGLAFVAKDPKLDPSTHTKQNIYYFPWNQASSQMIAPTAPGIWGATSNPKFAHNGKTLAFLGMERDGYESDKNQVFVIEDVTKSQDVLCMFRETNENGLYDTASSKGTWDRSPIGIFWSQDDREIYLPAENLGNTAIYAAKIPTLPAQSDPEPRLLRSAEHIKSITVLKNGKLFVSADSMTDNSFWYILDPSDDYSADIVTVLSASKHGEKFGLSKSQVSEIWWEGAKQPVHAWVIKPSNFDESRTYPLAYLIHGGPQGAWTNAWSTRWNPALFAEQGYVVVCPNPTGSTGYGQDFTDAIQNQWGGLPYEDLVWGFKYIRDHLYYVDTDNPVALGASYGGYMVNWIQGHEFGRQFKALVTHDGKLTPSHIVLPPIQNAT